MPFGFAIALFVLLAGAAIAAAVVWWKGRDAREARQRIADFRLAPGDAGGEVLRSRLGAGKAARAAVAPL